MPSTVVQSMHYYPDTRTLRIRYVSGIVYDYQHVPEAVFEAMKAAGSKGRFLNRHIKGNYDFVKVPRAHR
jgi:hypothetical protein